MTFVGKVWSLLFIMLSRLLTTFHPRSKRLLISWVQSPHGDFGHQWLWRPKKIKSVTVSIVSPCICHEVMGPDAMTLVFWKLSFKQIFWLSSFTFIKRLFSSSSLSAIRVAPSAYLRLLIFLPAILITACIVYCILSPCLQPWHTPFQIWNQSVVPHPVLTVASWLPVQISQETGQVVWYSHLLKNFCTVSCDLHRQRFWHNQ